MPPVAEAVKVHSRVRDLVRVGLTVSVIVTAVALLALLNRQTTAPTAYSFPLSSAPVNRIDVQGPDGATYTRFDFPSGTDALRDAGKPELPIQREHIALPCNATNIRVDFGGSVENTTLSAPLYPAPQQVPHQNPDGSSQADPVFTIDRTLYATNAWYPAHTVTVESTNVLRKSVCYAVVAVTPYRYNPVQHVLSLTPSLTVTLRWDNPTTVQSAPSSVGTHFDSLVQKMQLQNTDTSGAKNIIAAFSSTQSGSEQTPALTDGTVSRPTNLLVDQSPAPPHTDYLMIASNDLVNGNSPALDQLATFRAQAAHGGYNVSIVKVSDILGTQFPDIVAHPEHTFTDAEKVKVFLKYAYENWNGSDPAPEFVLLAGDGDGTADQIVPVFRSDKADVTQTPADYWLSANLDSFYPDYLTDTGNPIGDMFIGRIPAKTDTELQFAVDKTIQLESVAPLTPGAWRSQAELFSAFRSDSGNYVTASQDFFTDLQTQSLVPHAVASTVRYRDLYGNGVDETSKLQYHDDVISDLQQGKLYLVDSSHGSINTWSDGTPYQNVFAIADIANLQNSAKPPIVLTLACSTGAFDTTYTDSLAEAFLKNNANGAAAYFGATGIAYLYDYPLLENVTTAMFNQGLHVVGEAVAAGKQTASGAQRLTFQYFGDPALDLSQVLQVSAGLPDLTGSLDSYTIANGQVTASVTVKNLGLASAANVSLALYQNNDAVSGATAVLAGVLAGSTTSTTITFPQPTPWVRGSKTTISLHVDAQNTIPETLETNNVSVPVAFVVYDHPERWLATGSLTSQGGNAVVYMDVRQNNADIYMYDRSTHSERRITSDTSPQTLPMTDGATVVWQDFRTTVPSLYAYTIATGQERKLSSSAADVQQAAISGANVVWEDQRNGNADIYRYNLTTNRETQLTTSSAEQTGPAISGTNVVWLDNRDGQTEIYRYNLDTGQETRLTNSNADKMQATISGSVVVWSDNRHGTYDLYSYDLVSGQEHRVTNWVGDETQPTFDGSTLAWLDTRNTQRDVYARSAGPDGIPGTTDDGPEKRLTDNPSLAYRSALHVSGGKITYYANNGTNQLVNGVHQVMQVDALQALTPTATNRDGVMVSAGNRADGITYANDLRARWIRTNVDANGTGDTHMHKFLDAGFNLFLTFVYDNPNNIDESTYGTLAEWPSAGFPYATTQSGKQTFQDDIGTLVAPLVPYLDAGRQIYLQYENEVSDSSVAPQAKYWRGTTAQYLSNFDAFAEKVRALDSRFKVVLSSFTNQAEEAVIDPLNPSYGYQISRLGTMLSDTNYDAIDLHFYGCPTTMGSKVQWFRDYWSTNNIVNKEWVTTENGGPMPNYCDYPVNGRYVDWNNPTELTTFEDAQAAQVSQRMGNCAADGGSICLWFSEFDLNGEVDDFNHLGLLTQETVPRKKSAYTAFQNYTALNTNTAPVLTPIGNQTVTAGATLTFVVNGYDSDNNPLTFSASNLPTGATFLNQTFTWTPTVGQAGIFPNVHFSVTDGALTDAEDISITVTVNQPPTLTPTPSQTANEGSTLTFSVLASDPNGDTLTYAATNVPQGATFSGRTLTWRVSGQSAGSYLVHLTVTDGQYTDAQDVAITIQDISTPSITPISPVSVTAQSPIAFTVNATDTDADPLTLAATGLPAGATFISGRFSWTPSADQIGTSTVHITATDLWNTAASDVILTVGAATPPANTNNNTNTANTNQPINTNQPSGTNTAPPATEPPIISAPDTETIAVGAPFTMTVRVTNTQVGVTILIAGLPSGATFTDNHDGTGTLIWTPSTEQSGLSVVTFIAVSDGGSATHDVALLVTGASGGESLPLSKNFTAFPKSFNSGFSVATGNVWGDARDEIIVGTGPKTVNMIRVYSNDGTLLSSFTPLPKSITGGVRVAACDLNNDGTDEILAAPASGYKPYIRIFNVQGKQVLKKQFWTLDGKVSYGLNIACADLNGDKVPEVIAASDVGSGQITVHRPNGTRISNFLPFGKSYRGGMTVTALSTASGMRILAAKVQGGEFRAFTLQGKRSGPGYAPFGKTFTGGLALVTGDINADGVQDVLVTPLSKSKPRVKVFANDLHTLISQFYAYPTTFTGGVRTAIGDTDGDGTQNIITVPASKRVSDVLQFDLRGKSISD